MTTFETQPNVSDDSQTVSRAMTLALASLRLPLPLPWTQSTPSLHAARDGLITLAEVSLHDHAGDCWIVLYDRVYDVTSFVNKHPGGIDVLLEHAGRDATIAFHGTGHSEETITLLCPLFKGELPLEERIYRKNGGIKLRGIPE